MRTRHLPWMLASRVVGDRLMRRLDALPDALTAVYRSIQEVTGAAAHRRHLEAAVVRLRAPAPGRHRPAHPPRRPRPSGRRLLVDADQGAHRRRASAPRCSGSRPPRARSSGTCGTARRAGCGVGSDRYLRLRYEDLAEPTRRPPSARIAAFAGVPTSRRPSPGPGRSPPRPCTPSPATPTACAAARSPSALDDAWRSELPAALPPPGDRAHPAAPRPLPATLRRPLARRPA